MSLFLALYFSRTLNFIFFSSFCHMYFQSVCHGICFGIYSICCFPVEWVQAKQSTNSWIRWNGWICMEWIFILCWCVLAPTWKFIMMYQKNFPWYDNTYKKHFVGWRKHRIFSRLDSNGNCGVQEQVKSWKLFLVRRYICRG